MYPKLGATGSPYARSVIPTHTRDINLPDPGLIFDSKKKTFCFPCRQVFQNFVADIL